jgi:2-polyprenyl-3-methyl-5-hydroxy-6-metoxy-1,4-benzoquinol methylase
MTQSPFAAVQRPWFKDLCDYYNVPSDIALALGTRSTGRRPNLPPSPTTHAVSGKTFEDIWALSPRDSQEEVFKFYKDQGAWSSFRQVVRHMTMRDFHLTVLQQVLDPGSTYCEYGCGVAPFTHSLLETVDQKTQINICLSDVDCEHFTFGVWRARRVIAERNLENVSLEVRTVLPNELPVYTSPLDTVLIFEVLEHVPSPVSTIRNLTNQIKTGGLLCENFISHPQDDNDADGPDLKSAARERNAYYEMLEQEYTLAAGKPVKEFPNDTRVWRKK